MLVKANWAGEYLIVGYPFKFDGRVYYFTTQTKHPACLEICHADA